MKVKNIFRKSVNIFYQYEIVLGKNDSLLIQNKISNFFRESEFFKLKLYFFEWMAKLFKWSKTFFNDSENESENRNL